MSRINIRAWSAYDGAWLTADARLQKQRSFKKYGLAAKLFYVYVTIFYKTVVVEIDEDE